MKKTRDTPRGDPEKWGGRVMCLARLPLCTAHTTGFKRRHVISVQIDDHAGGFNTLSALEV